MSPSAKKPALVRRSVVELDLVGYSHVARELERHTDARAVLYLNEQVQRFVDEGLREAGCARKDVVNGTAGDNALLVFERASEAHRFSDAVHHATAKHNAAKTDSATHRHFRIGISTGEIAVRGKEISGTRIIDSVRLEAAGEKGHILIDEATYEELPAKFQQCYRGPESVADKQNNSHRVYRFVVVEPGDVGAVAPGLAAAKEDLAARAQVSCPVDISRIIKYAPAELIGREAETNFLSDAWEQAVRGESKRPHILTFVALGGEGKTSLVAKWAADLAFQNWRECDAVFAWSFYSQGTREQAAASSDLFLKEALIFFGDPAMAGSAQGMFDKGRRLAQLVGERRALLILDGLEPLQYAPTSPAPGELKDQGISALLKGLAANNEGLCVVTTRYSVPDLRAYWQTTAPEYELKSLSVAAGVDLLKKLGVKGTQKEFEELVDDVDGHALTLNLLGGFLQRAFKGDIRQRDRVKFDKANEKIQGGHAFRAMAAYEEWLLEGGDEGRREVAILRLMGLFDRPADAGCIEALRGESIPDLTEPIVGLEEDDWEFSLTGLEDAKLITVNRDAAGTLLSLDAHPLLREYFARQLRTQHPEAWRAAHRQLYEHLCATTKEGDEPTLEDLQPLYQAVAHGCLAGLQQEACDKVYFARIQRENKAYSVRLLGAFGSDLGAITCFFETQWSHLSPALSDPTQVWLLNEAGLILLSLGRLTDALDPMRAEREMRVNKTVGLYRSANVERSASFLSELELTLGNVAKAVLAAKQSVADLDGDRVEQTMTQHAKLANALNQAGQRSEADAHFRQAEAIQATNEPTYPQLHSVPGFMYCDLLLAAPERAAWQRTLASSSLFVAEPIFEELLGSCSAVSHRAVQTLGWQTPRNLSLLSAGLDYVTLGRAALYQAILEHTSFAPCETLLKKAVDRLRHAARQDELPKALLTRAWMRFLASDTEGARDDLDEAWEIAERGPMRLHMADIHLYRARLFHGVKPYPWTSPQDDLGAARKLIEQCGYWRRKEELENAEAAAKNW